MATKGNSELNKGIPQPKDAFVVIVKTEWNAHIVNKLEAGAKKIFKEQGIKFKTLVVPGAVEIPFIIKQYASYGKQQPADAFIAFGVVIKGDTPHFDYVCKSVSDGVLALNLNIGRPVIFGVLTVNDEQQALERVGGIHGHKGEEAAMAAIKMIDLHRRILK